jgi:thiamine biosynthesis protein ThiI
MDKEEITAEAERLGTYRISVIPDEDCCTLFTPRHPVTRARTRDVESAEATLPITDMIATAIGGAVVERFTYPEVGSLVQR